MIKQQAPQFSLDSTIGQPISDTDLRGAFAVLIFYPANDSPTCNRQLSEASLDMAAFMNLNTRVFGVNTAGIEKQKEYCLRKRLEFPILSDPGGKTARLYGATYFGFPVIARTVVVIDPTGEIIYHKRGNSPPSTKDILSVIETTLESLSRKES